MQNYVCNANFTENVLIVGRTGCEKTYFTQKLAVNRFFGKLKRVEWVSGWGKKSWIESCFSDDVDFHYLKLIEQFGDLLEVFKARSRIIKRNDSDENTSSSDDEFFNESDGFGEKTTREQLIVMDNVSGLADESKKFASFLTIARKFNYTCVYIFHIIYSEKWIWRTILSQTNIFNIFPASVSLAQVRRILESVCIRKTRNYIRQSALWISRLFIEWANRNERVVWP